MFKLNLSRIALLTLNTILVSGCGSSKQSSTADKILQRTWTVNQVSPPEKAYCNTPTSYNTNHAISGKALFEFRPIGTEVGEEGLRDISDTPSPIRHAQFDVTDSAGNILQCGETDGDGNFSFTVPRNNKALSINVYSRANNNFNRASVFIAPETNELYKIQHFFTANKSLSNIEIIAPADGELTGGAFNILEQIHLSFDVLFSNTIIGQGIAPENIPKADIYWEKGFNPGVYVGVDSGLSFFSKPQKKLFILGGLNGDVDFADTDHFDNSIILHEYFHFLESSVSVSHSPGGPHNGNQLLDPRLAWSEGAAQFYQAFVSGVPTVLDTRGNPDGSTGFLLKLSVENETSDIPLEDGEGEFREFGVARMLWDIHDSEAGESAPEGFDNVTGHFPDFWRAFSALGSAADFNSNKAFFASSSLLLEIIDFVTPIRNDADWQALLTDAVMTQPIDTSTESFRAQYAPTLVTSGLTDSFSVSGPFAPYDASPVLINNHPLLLIDYYAIRVPENSSLPISFTTSTANQAVGEDGEMQMYIFEEDYSNLSEHIAGPINAGDSVDLSGGNSGTTYLIAIAVSKLPVKENDEVEAIISYEFDGYAIGGF